MSTSVENARALVGIVDEALCSVAEAELALRRVRRLLLGEPPLEDAQLPSTVDGHHIGVRHVEGEDEVE